MHLFGVNPKNDRPILKRTVNVIEQFKVMCPEGHECLTCTGHMSARVHTCPHVSTYAFICPDTWVHLIHLHGCPTCIDTCPHVSTHVYTCLHISHMSCPIQLFRNSLTRDDVGGLRGLGVLWPSSKSKYCAPLRWVLWP